MSENQGLNRPIWLAESTHAELVEKLLVGLREVTDPELGLNIIQLGIGPQR